MNFPVENEDEWGLDRATSAPAELALAGGVVSVSARGRPRKRPAHGGSAGGLASGTKGSSKYRGVSWNSSCSRWRAQVRGRRKL